MSDYLKRSAVLLKLGDIVSNALTVNYTSLNQLRNAEYVYKCTFETLWNIAHEQGFYIKSLVQKFKHLTRLNYNFVTHIYI